MRTMPLYLLLVISLVLSGCAGGLRLGRKAEAPPPTPPQEEAPTPETAPEPPQEVLPEAPAGPVAAPERKPVRPAPPPPPPPEPEHPEVAAEPPFVCPPDDLTSGRDHYMKGIDALQVGNGEGAEQSLSLSLCKTPDNKIAASLLRQIRAPLEEIFAGDEMAYEVQPGDTLSKISRHFYGDPFLFYALARYNEMGNPSMLKVGETIRIPAVKGAMGERPVPREVRRPPEVPAAAEPPAVDRTPPSVAAIPGGGNHRGPVTVELRARDDVDPSPTVFYTRDGTEPGPGSQRYRQPIAIDTTTTLRFLAIDAAGNRSPVESVSYTLVSVERDRQVAELKAAGDYAGAIRLLEAAYAESGRNQRVGDQLAATCAEYAERLRGEGRSLESREQLARAVEVRPGDAALRGRLARAEREIGIGRFLEDGTQAEASGDLEKARAAYAQVLELDPQSAEARSGLARTRTGLVELHSKNAMAAFRGQNLDESIRQWDKVLELDPDNEMAKLRKAEAEDLKKRFEKKFD